MRRDKNALLSARLSVVCECATPFRFSTIFVFASRLHNCIYIQPSSERTHMGSATGPNRDADMHRKRKGKTKQHMLHITTVKSKKLNKKWAKKKLRKIKKWNKKKKNSHVDLWIVEAQNTSAVWRDFSAQDLRDCKRFFFRSLSLTLCTIMVSRISLARTRTRDRVGHRFVSSFVLHFINEQRPLSQLGIHSLARSHTRTRERRNDTVRGAIGRFPFATAFARPVRI